MSPALLQYLQATLPERSKPRAQALLAYAKYLDDPDRAVADDAFHEFAKSKDVDVGQASKQIDRALVRRLVQDSKNDPDRLSLFAFLLGGCGDQQDAKQLRALIEPPNQNLARALDGVLAGMYFPVARLIEGTGAWLKQLQNGVIQFYIALILATLLLTLWVAL